MGMFSGYYQNDQGAIVDSGGDELAINADGSLNVVTTIAPNTLVPLGYEQITVGATAVSLTVPTDSVLAIIQNEHNGKDVRWRDDGTAPTEPLGMMLNAGTTFEYSGDLDAFQLIRATGSSATTVNVSYYKYA